MLRDMDLSTETDGKKYSYNDMAKLGCKDCEGCSECCRTVESTIVLDPYDLYLLMKGTGKDAQVIFSEYLDLKVVDGVILPHIKMQPSSDACGFLSGEGRCSVHEYRPGFCRLYPLGRLYEDGDYSFILLKDQCHAKALTKVKISKWLSIPEYGRYHDFIMQWHTYLKKYQERFLCNPNDEQMKDITMNILKIFYLIGYDTAVDFYDQFEARMAMMGDMYE